ncbi:hypothetical protein BV22DRAFT_1036885 [Leucogyrophana mollusca]|uniref:Uncharacterized protein n=1 Tax=Leucogyrophana mollusca TaxID=85980 RepID=A0ACB8BBA2_9AGAM|nr:hypothetical protein BV22DRAFT_1036885 [Leucogyrophana mollusca]
MPPINLSLDKSSFSLDTSGVAGIFGGDEAISAMATVHLRKGRRWWGWYNSPGSYTVAKRFGQLANSRLWDGLFPGPNVDPAIMFELDGKVGPKYVASQSGSVIKRTTHLAYLLSEKCKELQKEKVAGRATRPERVTVVELGDFSHDKPIPTMSFNSTLLACIPTTVSAATCAACGLAGDWFCFSMILLGIISSGLSCLIIGSGLLQVDTVVEPAPGAPPGDGMLLGEEIVLLKGKERCVNFVTKGRFVLNMEGRHGKIGPSLSEHPDDMVHEEKRRSSIENGGALEGRDLAEEKRPEYRSIGLCSLLLVLQFLLQLLFIPQGTLFGQIMFIVSLVVSWGYNSFLSSLEKEKIQADILYELLNKPSMKRYELGTRTTMSIFVILILRPLTPMKMLNEFLPNDTEVWKIWKGMVVKKILAQEKLHFEEADWPRAAIELDDNKKKLLITLLGDATAAWDGYISYRPNQYKGDSFKAV